MTSRRITVVLNPRSGKGQNNPGAETLRTWFSENGADVRILVLQKGVTIPDLVDQALEQNSDIVVAAGGDGTIRGVAEALAGSETPMGVLAFGTFNYFARSLSLPEDIKAAVGVIVNGTARPVRVGRINNHLFLNNTSVGRYPEILANREGIYERWGRSRLAAYWSVLVTLFALRRPLELNIEADGTPHTLRTPLIFVLNNAFQMEEMGLEGHDALADGKLVMYLSPDRGRWGLLRQALALAMGILQKGRDFHVIAAHRFEIEARRKRHRIALDGERRKMRTPLVINAALDDLWVVTPADLDREVR